MSVREKAIQLLKDLHDDIPMKEIIDTLSLIIELRHRIDTFDEKMQLQMMNYCISLMN